MTLMILRGDNVRPNVWVALLLFLFFPLIRHD